MSEIILLKNQLIDTLWLPIVKRGGDIFYPRLRKNKKMKVLTLTNDRNFQEIKKFIENNLTTKERVFVWNHSLIKKLRLETELSPAIVLGTTRYEDSISSSSFSLRTYFPFDVINLDFSSQDPDLERGRIEKEIQSLEKTVKSQKEKGNERFVLIYTTLLNSNNLDYRSIVNRSNAIQVARWSGLSLESFPSSIVDPIEKVECISTVLSKICLKFDYDAEIENRCHRLGTTPKYICSIIGLLGGG